jgi:hypothetical protein
MAAAAAFWTDEQAALEQAEAIALIARQIKFRPKSVLTLPVERKAKHLAGMAQVSDLLAARLLVAYHLQNQRPMMGRFLDELGIALDKAAKALASEFPKPEVACYFWTLLWQDPETWGGLKDRPELTI